MDRECGPGGVRITEKDVMDKTMSPKKNNWLKADEKSLSSDDWGCSA
jgi:hypothetical protein